MALIKCKECGKEISDTAKKCPNCGYRNKNKSKNRLIMIIVFLVLVSSVSSGAYFYFDNQAKVKQEIEAKALAVKNAEIAEAKKIKDAEDAKKRRFTANVKKCVRGIVTVRNALKNPESLIVNYVALTGTGAIYIDLTAENGFGGSVRSLYYVTDNDDGFSSLDYETKLYYRDWTELLDISIAKLTSETDKVDDKAILELYNEYLKTKNFKILQ